MAKSFQQKLKILYLMKAFLEKTDERHPMSVKELIRYLEGYGISAERKTIYDDIETLRIFGMRIENTRKRPAGYYLADRDFETAELKLLVDAVQSSRFITDRKSRELIGKLEGLTSVYEAKQLRRQVFVENRVKTVNEEIYSNIDRIDRGISGDRQITFQYFEWTLYREMRLKKNGERYRVSPWGLVWKDENYYLIALDEKSGIVKHYRVDKMLKLRVEDLPRSGKEIFERFDPVQFAARTFGMFGGHSENLTIVFHIRLVGVILDRFGRDVTMLRRDEEHFAAMLKINVSTQFFGWLAALGADAQIEAPEKVRREYISFLKQTLSVYENGGLK